jgi:hypothetical protein
MASIGNESVGNTPEEFDRLICTRPIVDDDLLAKCWGRRLRNEARHRVSAATG